jgi:hypothetical protein
MKNMSEDNGKKEKAEASTMNSVASSPSPDAKDLSKLESLSE